MRALCLLSYRVTRSAFDKFSCLIKFVTDSARNHAGADQTCTLMLATRVRTRKSHGRKKSMARPDPYGLQVCWVVWSPYWLPLVSHSPVHTARHGYSYQSARGHTVHARTANGTRMMHVQKPNYILTARGPVNHSRVHVTTTSRNGHFVRTSNGQQGRMASQVLLAQDHRYVSSNRGNTCPCS